MSIFALTHQQTVAPDNMCGPEFTSENSLLPCTTRDEEFDHTKLFFVMFFSFLFFFFFFLNKLSILDVVTTGCLHHTSHPLFRALEPITTAFCTARPALQPFIPSPPGSCPWDLRRELGAVCTHAACRLSSEFACSTCTTGTKVHVPTRQYFRGRPPSSDMYVHPAPRVKPFTRTPKRINPVDSSSTHPPYDLVPRAATLMPITSPSPGDALTGSP